MDIETLLLDVKKLGERVSALKESISTEEATKTSLIMPFFQLLGYDVFNPLEFSPEYIADVGIKKGEKVDYAILNNNNPIILIEAKSIKEDLKNHDSQLFRYFGTTTAKFGILTNGNEYRFYTDLEEPNKMDRAPFFSFVLTEVKDVQISEIFKFQKENFDVDNISKAASDLKYLNFVKEFLTKEVNDPSEEFVKFILGEIYDGIKTKVIIDKFTPVIKRGFRQFIADQVNSKLNAALNTSVSVEELEVPQVEVTADEEEDIITTEAEIEAFTTTKLLLKDTIDTSRIFYRDNKSYFNIIIDNSIRKWVLRLYMNNSRTYFVINDEEKTTIEIVDVIDIFNHADKIIPVVERYL